MTTIAYDGRQIAADTLISCGDFKFGYQNKIHELSGDRYAAFSGNEPLVTEFVKWLEGGMSDEPPKCRDGDDICGLYIDEHRNAWEFDKTARMFSACVPWTGGTGQKYAMACMRVGTSASRAVQIAIDLDPYSGGQVQVVNLDD